MAQRKKPKKKAVKKRTKEWLRRSAAAKRGWQTRKKRELPKKIKRTKVLIDNALKAKRKKPKVSILQLKPRKRKPTVRELEDEVSILRRKLKRHEKDLSSEKWVDAADPEYIRKDGTIALLPSRLRGLEETAKLYNELRRAEKRGKDSLWVWVERMAQFYDLPVREVYTLLKSP